MCEVNGTWYVSPDSQREWTDYRRCLQLDNFWMLFWVGVICNALSLALLLPACFIFIYFRSLRIQHRVKLHICLFVSYVLTNGTMVVWELVLVRDTLVSGNDESILHQNSVGCRILYALTRYTWTANFVWMFIEGLHLYRLMVYAFAPPTSLNGFYIAGFGIPWISTLVYICIRATNDDLNTRCWVQSAGAYEWFIYTPLIICIAGNIFFLGTIVSVMVTQLQSHPNEPSSFRRAVKAVAMLVPLFGLQVVLVVVRPEPFNPAFEVVSKVITNTQGALVAVCYCYLNGEVLTIIRNVLPCSLKPSTHRRIDQRHSVSTQNTTDGCCRSPLSMNSACTAVTPTSTCGKEDGYVPLFTLGDDPHDKAESESEHQNGFL